MSKYRAYLLIGLIGLVAFLPAFIFRVYVTDWSSCTLTLSNDTNVSSNVAFCRKIGDSLEVNGLIQWNGAGAGGTFTVSPDGYTFNTDKMAGGTNTANGTATILGTSEWFENGVAFKDLGTIYNGSNAVRFHENPGNLQGTAISSGDAVRVSFSVPVQ